MEASTRMSELVEFLRVVVVPLTRTLIRFGVGVISNVPPTGYEPPDGGGRVPPPLGGGGIGATQSAGWAVLVVGEDIAP